MAAEARAHGPTRCKRGIRQIPCGRSPYLAASSWPSTPGPPHLSSATLRHRVRPAQKSDGATIGWYQMADLSETQARWTPKGPAVHQ